MVTALEEYVQEMLFTQLNQIKYLEEILEQQMMEHVMDIGKMKSLCIHHI